MVKTIYPTKQFKRDVKKQCMELVTANWVEVLNCLVNDLPMPEKCKDHALSGELKNCRDCHVKPDLVLIYEYRINNLILHRLGCHSEVF